MSDEPIQIQALEADHDRDQVLAMLAHEMRNPLAAIALAGDMLERVGLQIEHSAKFRAMIKHQTHVLSRMVEDLLEISRITRGKLKLVCEPLDITTIGQHAVDTTQSLMKDRQHDLLVSFDPRPMRIVGDAVRLEQVLVNLLGNAAKFSEPGSRIRFSAEPDREEVVLRVVDDGIGISADMLPRVFDLFAQAETSMGRSGGGLGVGLALVRSYVEMHRGTVVVASAGVGQGSEFTVRLPALREQCDCEPSPAHSTNCTFQVQGPAKKTGDLRSMDAFSVAQAPRRIEGTSSARHAQALDSRIPLGLESACRAERPVDE
jgi:two-component system, sensor histidine kinase